MDRWGDLLAFEEIDIYGIYVATDDPMDSSMDDNELNSGCTTRHGLALRIARMVFVATSGKQPPEDQSLRSLQG